MIEILIAVVLVGILSAVAVVGISNLTSKASSASCAYSADAAKAASFVYFASNASYPTTLTDMTKATPAILTLPTDVTVDGTGFWASGSNWRLIMDAATSGVAPTFACTTNQSGGMTVGPNHHMYQLVSTGATWAAAVTAAANTSFNGRTGYLATVTDATENAFIKTLATGSTVWLAGSDALTEGSWIWTTGPQIGIQFWSGASNGAAVGASYTAWNGGEPNNSGVENCLTMVSAGGWNDLSCTATNAYVIEYG